MEEGLDSIMTLLQVVTLATNCKSSGGHPLEEDSNLKGTSISNGSATITETKECPITVKRYTRTGGQSVLHGSFATALT
jgi:hypothetical protein